MRLLHVRSFAFEQFPPFRIPPYAILSHRWSQTELELKLQDVQQAQGTPSFNASKIRLFAQYVQLEAPELQWIWIDTCCIDRDNASEVSDAIDSMFDWYKSAELCVAYLYDVHTTDIEAFRRSVWFERGWTLQELIAPASMVFLNSTWQLIGHKGNFKSEKGLNLEVPISARTGVPLRALMNSSAVQCYQAEQKLRWMQDRMTLYKEDLSYAMYGIFGIAIGARYGEKKADKRLEQAIQQTTQRHWTVETFSFNVSAIETATLRFSASLDEVYARALMCVEENDRKNTLTLLIWLAYSYEPMTVQQLLEVLVTRPSINTMEMDKQLTLQQLLKLLLPFANITGPGSSLEMKVQLLHPSLREYLESGRLAIKYFQLNGERDHHLIEQICLTCMLYCKETEQEIALLAYCLRHWHTHTRASAASPELVPMNSTRLAVGLRAAGRLKGLRNEDCGNPVQAAACAGLVDVLDVLIHHGSDVNIVGGHYGQPLQAAAAGSGDPETIKMLLQAGAAVDADGGRYGRALVAAAARSHIAVLEILVAAGADISYVGPKGSALTMASTTGNRDIVRLLLELDTDVNAKGGDEGSALIGASLNGHTDVVRMLLAAGAKVDLLGRGWPALHVAAQNNHTEVMQSLLQSGADVDSKNIAGSTSLYIASANGSLQAVRLLLSYGAYVDNKSPMGWSALNAACHQNHLEVIQALIHAKASLGSPTNSGRCPLDSAMSMGYMVAAQLLVLAGAFTVKDNDEKLLSQHEMPDACRVLPGTSAECEKRDSDGFVPLRGAADAGCVVAVGELPRAGVDIRTQSIPDSATILSAAINGRTEVVRRLLDAGANPKVQNDDGWTPLTGAAENGHYDVVRLLLQANVNVNEISSKGWSALALACANKHFRTVSFLLNRGANTELATRNRKTPLHLACAAGRCSIMEILLDAGADVDAKDADRCTPVLMAAERGHDEAVELLISRGADIEAPSAEYGWTALCAASSKGHSKIVSILLAAQADKEVTTRNGYNALHHACQSNHLAVSKLLLESGASVHAITDDIGWSAITLAAHHGSTDSLQLLVDHGANIEHALDDGNRALHIAANNNHLEVLTLLLDLGASVEAVNGDGSTALYVASARGHVDILQALLVRGASVHAQGSAGTALQAAISRGHQDVAAILVQRGADVSNSLSQGIKGIDEVRPHVRLAGPRVIA